MERQSALIETIKPLLTSLLGRPILAGPRDYRVEIWTLCFHYFLSIGIVVFDGAGPAWWDPNLISQDLRYNALPLYFSRPLRRSDYFLGKLGVIVALLAAVIIVPSCVAYVLGLLFSLDITILRDTSRILLASVDLWAGDRRIRGNADARALVAVAQFAVCGAVLDGHLDSLQHGVLGAGKS